MAESTYIPFTISALKNETGYDYNLYAVPTEQLSYLINALRMELYYRTQRTLSFAEERMQAGVDIKQQLKLFNS